MEAKLISMLILILLSLSVSCLSDPVQNPDIISKRTTGEDGDVEETITKTQIDQLYQIYQATQNNIKKITTEFNEQLANLRAELNNVHYEMDNMKRNNCTKRACQSYHDNSPAPLYQTVSCRQETVSCKIQPLGPGNNYWVWCRTGELPVNVTNYYTTSMRFETESNWDFPLESTVVRMRKEKYYGVCHVTWIDPYKPQHNPIKRDLRYKCTLVVTRCPYFSNTKYN